MVIKKFQVLSVFVILFFSLGVNASEINFYVSSNGNDVNPGTKDLPVASLNAARDLVRLYKSIHDFPQGGITIWVSGGDYYQQKSFVLNDNDSGTSDEQIVWRAVEGEKVSIRGGITLPASSFQKLKDKQIKNRLTSQASKNVLTVNLKDLGITNYGKHEQYGHALSVYPAPLELFFNNEPMTLAKYPNEGFIQIGNVIDGGSVPRIGDYSERGATFNYTDERHTVWSGDDDIWFQGTFSNGYADDKIHVASIDPVKKEVKLSKPHMYGVKGGKDYQHYVALNILDELDMPGEYYVDRKSGILYFWPPSKINQGQIMISILEDPVVSLEGVNHLTFRDFIVEIGRGIGVYMERGSNNTVAGCTVRNFGTSGIWMGQGAKQTVPYITHDHYKGVPISGRIGNYSGQIYEYTTWDRKAGRNNKILSCDVYNTGAGGVMLSGGSKRKLIPGNNVVKNCKIHDYNRRNKFRWGGVVVDGCGNKVSHNEIYNSDFQAIFTVGPEHVFEYNNIHHTAMHAYDVSVWYTGRDPSDRGIQIRYNYFHDCGDSKRMNMGVYCDDSSGGITVFGNVFYNMHTAHGVLYSNTGWDITMKNNIVIKPHSYTAVLSPHYYTWYKGKAPIVFDKGKLFERRLFNDININKPPYSERYPELGNYMNVIEEGVEWEGMRSRRNVLSTNIIIGGRENPISIRGGKYGVFKNIDNLILSENKDPGFVDYENGNFQLREDSEVFKSLPNFEAIPFSKIGLYVDEFRKAIQ